MWNWDGKSPYRTYTYPDGTQRKYPLIGAEFSQFLETAQAGSDLEAKLAALTEITYCHVVAKDGKVKGCGREIPVSERSSKNNLCRTCHRACCAAGATKTERDYGWGNAAWEMLMLRLESRPLADVAKFHTYLHLIEPVRPSPELFGYVGYSGDPHARRQKQAGETTPWGRALRQAIDAEPPQHVKSVMLRGYDTKEAAAKAEQAEYDDLVNLFGLQLIQKRPTGKP